MGEKREEEQEEEKENRKEQEWHVVASLMITQQKARVRMVGEYKSIIFPI